MFKSKGRKSLILVINIPNTNDTSDIIIQLERSFAPMEKTLFQLQDAMQEITNECTVGGIPLYDLHATTLLKIGHCIKYPKHLTYSSL